VTSGGKEPVQVQGDKVPVGVVDAPPAPIAEVEGHDHGVQEKDHEDEEGDEEVVRKPLWGPCECCISCVSPPLSIFGIQWIADRQVVTEYFHNENFEGVGQGTSLLFSEKVLMARPPNMSEPPKCQYRSRLDPECTQSTCFYALLGPGGKEENTVTYLVGVVGWDGS
jgi:hypothetical protein